MFKWKQALLIVGMAILPTMSIPVIAEAATGGTPTSLDDLLSNIANTIIQIFPVLFGIATVIFIISIIRYIFSADADQSKIRSTILWSVIGLAAIISLWALVGYLTSYVGTSQIPPNPYQ